MGIWQYFLTMYRLDKLFINKTNWPIIDNENNNKNSKNVTKWSELWSSLSFSLSFTDLFLQIEIPINAARWTETLAGFTRSEHFGAWSYQNTFHFQPSIIKSTHTGKFLWCSEVEDEDEEFGVVDGVVAHLNCMKETAASSIRMIWFICLLRLRFWLMLGLDLFSSHYYPSIALCSLFREGSLGAQVQKSGHSRWSHFLLEKNIIKQAVKQTMDTHGPLGISICCCLSVTYCRKT